MSIRSQQLSQAASRPAVQIQLPTFEGPFDLLIYLVERDKLSIHEIAISEITNSYIESIKVMQQFDPELASEFIYMAAYLLELKSRSLLPRVERKLLAEENDPRQELIMRLVEYKRFKELAERLGEMAAGSNVLHTRQPSLLPTGDETRPLANMSLDNLFSAYNRAMEKFRVEVRELPARGVAVSEKIDFLRTRLSVGLATFDELVDEAGLIETIVTFLAVLELVRMREAVVHQDSAFGNITIEALQRDDEDE